MAEPDGGRWPIASRAVRLLKWFIVHGMRPQVSQGSNRPRIDAAEILEGIREWVLIETPSHDGPAVNRLVDLVERQMAALGTVIERTPGREGFGDILTARTPWGGDGPGILVLSHLDTVHPIGTLNAMPFERKGDAVHGPGIYDMKGGAYLAYYALRHLTLDGRTTPLPVTFLYVPEEEVGSPTSRAAIEREARRAKYVLVTEPAREGGRIVLARKGAAHYDLKVVGRAAHAGMRHQDGRNAVAEMARQVLAIEAMTDYERGITCSVGTISGGTGVNVVPAECLASVDCRVPDMATAAAMQARFMALRPRDPDCRLSVSGGLNRPPYETDAGIAALFQHAKGLAAEIGFDLQGVTSGGGSDGNFTAALGVPTLDGLGVDGRGAHAADEQLYYSSLEPRTRLLLRLLETLG